MFPVLSDNYIEHSLYINPLYSIPTFTEQKIKFFIREFYSKCDQIQSLLRISSYLPKKSLMGNFMSYIV